MATLDELALLLEANSVGHDGVDLFKATRPETPDVCLTLTEYPGNAPLYVQESPAPKHENVQVQVMARGGDYPQARSLAYSAWAVLSRVTNQTLSGVRYLSIRPSSSPALVGRDGNDRVLVSFNLTVEKEVN